MDTKSVKTILMHGPDLTDSKKMVEREVPLADEYAYRAAGYLPGELPKTVKEIVMDETRPDGSPMNTYTEAEAKEQAEVKKPKAKTARKKK